MSILRSTVIVTLLSFLSIAVSFVNQLILARFFGASTQMDAYLIAISLPLTVSGLLSGVLSYQLVPALQRAETQHNNGDALLRLLVWIFVGGATICALLCAGCARWLIDVLNPNLPSTEQVLATGLAGIAWWSMPLAILGAIYTAGLHVRLRFAAATLLTSAPTIGALSFCLLTHAYLGVESVIWGQLIGYCVMVGGLRHALGRRRAGQDWAGLRKVLTELPLSLGALCLFIIYPFSDALWGSRIGPAAVSYLGYAQRLVIGFAGVAVASATTVLFPQLARQAAQGAGEALRNDLMRSLRTILLCMMPAAVLLGMLALPILQLIFQHGAFALSDSVALAALLPWILAGMVAMSCMVLIFKAIFALGKLRAAATLSVGGSVVYFGLSGVLAHAFRLQGIGISYALTWWLVLICSFSYIFRGSTATGNLISNNRQFVLRLISNTLLVGLTCWLGSKWLPAPASSNQLGRFAAVFTTSVVATIVYLIAGNTLLASNEMRILTQGGLRLFE